MRRVALLDVNVLVALFDPEHVHHEAAHDWFADHRAGGWSSCPLTENGLIRIIANPARRGELTTAADAARLLRQFRASGHHEFWPDAISLCDERLFDVAAVRGYKQLTDVYLLGLAVKRSGCLVTFDGAVPVAAVKGARREQLAVIAPPV